MEESWPKAAYSPDKDPVYPGNQKEYDKALRSKEEGGLGLSASYIHRDFPRRVYDPNGGTKLIGNRPGQTVEECREELKLALSEGWGIEAIAAKPADIVIKGQTQAEYENQIRISKLEATIEQMMEILREKAAVQLEPAPRKRGRPAKAATSE